MITCPKCKTTGIPEDAKFCPNCGTALQTESEKRMTISECRLVPNVIKKGEQCRLVWKGENVKYIEIACQHYNVTDDIFLTPSKSQTFRVSFGGEGTSIMEEVHVMVETPLLFGDQGEKTEIGWRADARKLVRVSGIGMQGKFYFNGDMSDDRNICFYVSEGNRWMTISTFKGRIYSISYHSGIDILKKTQYGDVRHGHYQPSMETMFFEQEAGLILKRKTGIMYRYSTKFYLGYRLREDGIWIEPELSEAEWMNLYRNDFYDYCDQYLPLLKKIFGIDPIYENPFWRW